MDNRVYHQYKNKKFDVAIGFPCDGLGDTICATPSVRKLSEAYNTKITVYSKHPVVFQNLPYVKSSHRYMDIHDNQDLKNSFDYYYQTEIAITHFNDQDVKFKHSHMDIRQIHANFLGFTLLKEDSHCDFIANKYKPIEKLPDKYIVIHATESWPSKDWGFENWNEFCNTLNYPIVMVGKDSKEQGSFMVYKPTYELKPKQGLDLRNRTDIHQLWHVLDKAQLIVTNDSSIMHLSGTTDTEILVLGSSQRPELRFPYRKGSQEYKIRMVLGSCDLFCASDLKYSVWEFGTINQVGPVPFCLEDKNKFECHPSVELVMKEVENIIDLRKTTKSSVTENNTVPIFKPSGGKLLAINHHLSTGGSCEYMLKFFETFKDNYDEIKVIEYSNFGDILRVHKDKIKDLIGEENVICLGELHVPMDQWIEEKRELKNIINDYEPDTIWFNELPSGFEYKQPEKKLMDWVYRENKPYEIICTTHNNKAFVRDERQANNKLPFYKPDKFVFCTRLNFEWSKHIDVEKELWEYPIENRIRPDRKDALDKLDLGDYHDYYHILQVGIVNSNKNQKFSIDLSKKLIHKKVMFHFIGNDTQIEKSGVSYDDFDLFNVKYWGERYDVDKFMSCMDLFLFPSLRELNPLSVKQALGWGMEVFALPKNHQHEELNYTLDYLDIKNFHLLKDEDVHEYINKQEIPPSDAKCVEIDLNDNIRSIYNVLGKARKEYKSVLVLDENQNVITDKIYSGTRSWKDYEKINLYTM